MISLLSKKPAQIFISVFLDFFFFNLSTGASGLGNPGSQFGIKLTTLPDTTTATPPQPSQEQQSLGGVRRSQRVRKKMTKLKTKASNQK